MEIQWLSCDVNNPVNKCYRIMVASHAAVFWVATPIKLVMAHIKIIIHCYVTNLNSIDVYLATICIDCPTHDAPVLFEVYTVMSELTKHV